MTDPATSPADPKEQHEEPSETGPHRVPPSYDADVEDYTGISAGALGDVEDVHSARAFAEMIVDAVREGLLVLGFDLRVKAANESFYHQFGVRPEETVGRLVYDLGDGQWDLPELRELLENILPHERAFDDYEVAHAFEGIGRRVLLLNGRRLNDHELILLAIEDVTERRSSERELRQSEERFRLLIENAWEYAIFSTDEEDRVTMWSPSAERILGWSREEALGMSGAAIFTAEDRAAGVPEREMARARAEGSAPDERWHERKDGRRFWATGMMVALQDDSPQSESLRGFTKILRDNTQRKEAEESLHRLNETLAEMNETLEERVEERTRQVRRHQRRLRELSRALALAEQEERRRIAHVLHDDLQQVLFGAKVALSLGHTEQLAGVLDEALELTRTLSHSLSPPFLQGEDVEDLLRWVAERHQQRHGLAVEVAVGGDVPVPDPALRVLLYQIVRELLFNVAKHAGTGRARVVAERVDGHVRLAVEDEGAGFDPAELDEPSAVGLGLPSVRERVELVGGRMEVESAPGTGTRITITVPVENGAAERA